MIRYDTLRRYNGTRSDRINLANAIRAGEKRYFLIIYYFLPLICFFLFFSFLIFFFYYRVNRAVKESDGFYFRHNVFKGKFIIKIKNKILQFENIKNKRRKKKIVIQLMMKILVFSSIENYKLF